MTLKAVTCQLDSHSAVVHQTNLPLRLELLYNLNLDGQYQRKKLDLSLEDGIINTMAIFSSNKTEGL